VGTVIRSSSEDGMPTTVDLDARVKIYSLWAVAHPGFRTEERTESSALVAIYSLSEYM
jgi:hypothetical protein